MNPNHFIISKNTPGLRKSTGYDNQRLKKFLQGQRHGKRLAPKKVAAAATRVLVLWFRTRSEERSE